jgi:uncharacterized oxidoreductase
MPTNTVDLRDACVLITGGSDGIGRGLAERFLKAGSTVLVTGRSQERLDRAASALTGLHIFRNDISQPNERIRLAEHVESQFPNLNVVINNAGIQRRIPLAADNAPWAERQAEIDTLLSAPIHLNHLLIPLMLKHGQRCGIVNVTSGGAFIPQVFAPIYSACKAALHSYTMTLRHALSGTSIQVVELIPPAVQTGLAPTPHGAPLDEFCDAVFSALASQKETIGFGPTDTPEFRQLIEVAEPVFKQRSASFSVATYGSATL